MDKRTLIFVILTSMTLMVVNGIFSHYDQERIVAWKAEQEAKSRENRGKLEEELTKTATPDQLPLVELDGKKRAIQLNGNLLAFSSQGEKITLNGKEYTLQGKEEGLALYRANGAAPIPTRTLPNLGNYQIQLVFEGSNTVGDLTHGVVSFPLQTLAKDFPNEFTAPAGDAFVFYKGDSDYQLIGLYSAAKKSLLPLNHFSFIPTLNEEAKPVAATSEKEEQFFVLENKFQQVVFSNFGGSVSEINLALQTKENPDSLVKEIDFDRVMEKEDPQNALFPSTGYSIIDEKGAKKRLASGHLGGYYPLLRRNLIQRPPYETVQIAPRYYAFNFVSKYPEVSEQVFTVKEFTDKQIVFEAKQPHRRVTKTYTIEDNYVIDLKIEIEGDARGLWLTTGVPDVEWINGAVAPALKYRSDAQVESISLPDSKNPETINSTMRDWIVNSNGFFGVILDPLTKIDPGYRAAWVSGTLVPSRLLEIDQKYELFKADTLPGYEMMIPLDAKGGTMQFRIFAGPFATDLLKRVDAAYSNPKTGYNPDYIASQTYHGWFKYVAEPFAKFLFFLMKLFYAVTGSWGFSIILLTLALRIMLYPLTAWSFRSMRKMQDVAPAIKAVQEKYKNDPKKLQVELAAVYREAGVNPVSGCLPMLIQLPFLIGMFDLLKSTFELRGASFIPGWIDDLAAPDIVFSWEMPIFFIGTAFHILPLFLSLTMLLQGRLSATKTDPSQMTDQERSMKGMNTVMAVLFGVLFYHAPSGLCIYWIFSSIFGMAQQQWTNWRLAKETKNPQVIVPSKGKKQKK